MARKTGPQKAARDIVGARSGGACEVGLRGCTGAAVDIQHRRARGMGGSRLASTNLPSSLIAVCRNCHSWIEGHLEVARLRGWSVRQSVGQPAGVPVLRLGEWVLLDDEGGISPVDLIAGS